MRSPCRKLSDMGIATLRAMPVQIPTAAEGTKYGGWSIPVFGWLRNGLTGCSDTHAKHVVSDRARGITSDGVTGRPSNPR
ncbi:hypothetical protein SDC9_171404 [bioreactor metagenome]|uniref:Uncharacterized protein n=1 Tax=bioreactor metagenome TaxID=1076179 RepID=A0A645GAT3_9ZZZZ